LGSFPPDTWTNRKNCRAAAVYLLSGGSAKTLKQLFDEKVFPDESVALIAASLAYAEGRSRDAVSLLRKFDPSAYPPMLRAHLALVEGGLLIGVDNSRAGKLFDLARLLMPKSLIEEAALRREINVIDPSRHSRKLLLLGERYAETYFRSPFAKQFWDDLVAITVRFASRLDGAKLASIETILERAPSSNRIDLCFGVARDSLLRGRAELAALHVTRAASIARAPSEKNRLKLYSALADIIGGKFESGAATAQELDPLKISQDDRVIRDVLVAMVASVSKLSNADIPMDFTKFNEQLRSEKESPILKETEMSLVSSAALLERALVR
jgi:chemotaxis protein MotC